MDLDRMAVKDVIEYIDNTFEERLHGSGVWITETGECITTDVGYAEEWWNNCMKPELLRAINEEV